MTATQLHTRAGAAPRAYDPPDPLRPIDPAAFRALAFGLAARGWIEAVRRPQHPTGMMAAALDRLAARERDIVTSRRLLDQPVPLDVLASRHRIGIEQVRFIERNAFASVQTTMKHYVARRRAASRQAHPAIRACG